MRGKEIKNLGADETTSPVRAPATAKGGRTSFSTTSKTESSRTTSRKGSAKAKETTPKGKRESASKPKTYTRKEVAELIHKRVNTINRKNGENTLKYRDKISELEQRNAELYHLLEEAIKHDGRANASERGIGARKRGGARRSSRAIRR